MDFKEHVRPQWNSKPDTATEDSKQVTLASRVAGFLSGLVDMLRPSLVIIGTELEDLEKRRQGDLERWEAMERATGTKCNVTEESASHLDDPPPYSRTPVPEIGDEEYQLRELDRGMRESVSLLTLLQFRTTAERARAIRV